MEEEKHVPSQSETPENEDDLEESENFRSMENAGSGREDHLKKLVLKKRRSMINLRQISENSNAESTSLLSEVAYSELSKTEKERLEIETKLITQENSYQKDLGKFIQFSEVEIKMNNFSYKTRKNAEDAQIRTIFNQNFIYILCRWMKSLYRREKAREKEEHVVLESVNLLFKPGRMYLVLGDPAGGGKEALLKAISGRLHQSKNCISEGSIQYNGLNLKVRGSRYCKD